jgi:hypothetical protein
MSACNVRHHDCEGKLLVQSHKIEDTADDDGFQKFVSQYQLLHFLPLAPIASKCNDSIDASSSLIFWACLAVAAATASLRSKSSSSSCLEVVGVVFAVAIYLLLWFTDRLITES